MSEEQMKQLIIDRQKLINERNALLGDIEALSKNPMAIMGKMQDFQKAYALSMQAEQLASAIIGEQVRRINHG